MRTLCDETNDILSVVEEIKSKKGTSLFVHGSCVSLAIHLYNYALEKYPNSPAAINCIYRLEIDEELDEEVSRTFSHATLKFKNNSIDINGLYAEENWYVHVDNNVPPSCDCYYNDFDGESLSGDEGISRLKALCLEYDIEVTPISDIPDLDKKGL